MRVALEGAGVVPPGGSAGGGAAGAAASATEAISAATPLPPPTVLCPRSLPALFLLFAHLPAACFKSPERKRIILIIELVLYSVG
jgi:hypothetical protein